MKILNLGKESYNLVSNLADNFSLGQILFCLSFVLFINIVKENNIVFYIKVQFSTQEFTQILMDEIIKCVARSIPFELPLKQRFAITCR